MYVPAPLSGATREERYYSAAESALERFDDEALRAEHGAPPDAWVQRRYTGMLYSGEREVTAYIVWDVPASSAA